MEDYLSALPDEIIHYLSDFLPFEEFDRLTGTCRRFYHVLRKKKIHRSRSILIWCMEGNLPAVRYVMNTFLTWSDPKYLRFQRPPVVFKSWFHDDSEEFCYGHVPVKLINDCFLESCAFGHLDIVRYLFENYPQHIKFPSLKNWRRHPLNYAIRHGRLNVTGYILQHVPETSECFSYKYILGDVSYSRSTDLLRYITSVYTFSDIQLKEGFDAACRIGCSEIVTYYFQNGTSFGEDDILKVLRMAFENEHADVVSLLLHRIRDKDVERIFGRYCRKNLEYVQQFVDVRVILVTKVKTIRNILLTGIENACAVGKLETVQYLENLTDLKGRKRINLGVRCNFILAQTFICEQFEMVKYLLGNPEVSRKNGTNTKRRFVYRYVRDAMKIYDISLEYRDRIGPVKDFLKVIIHYQNPAKGFSSAVRKQARCMLNNYRNDISLMCN